jgi:hypothetical protein
LVESKRPGWRDAKHAAQWGSTLEAYAYPKLGGPDVKAVDTTAVLKVLRSIWAEVPETASRVRQRIEAVLDYATATGARQGDNPARWRGHLDHLLPKPSEVRVVTPPWTGARRLRSWQSWQSAKASAPAPSRSRS